MVLKRIILTALLASNCNYNPTTKNEVELKPEIKKIEISSPEVLTRGQKEDLLSEPLFDLEFLIGESVPEPKTNSEYVSGVVAKDSRLSVLLSDGKRGLAEYISNRLTVLDHITPKNYSDRVSDTMVMENPPIEDLMKVEQNGLIQVYYLLQALSDKTFRKQIGRELELDTKDYSCEHGGALHLLSNGEVHIEMLPDDSRNPNIHFIGDEIKIGSHRNSPDDRYSPKDPKYTLDILGVFHFHAQEIDHRKSAALSGNDFWHGGAVFTRVGERKFNVDWALYYQINEKHWQQVNLDCGIYEY